jgi:hypothetical protein
VELMRGARALVLVAAFGAASSHPRDARAQSDDAPAALALFEQGRRLVGEGKLEEACPKFQESVRLVPKVSTLLNLADCYEQSGRLASAWARYMEAAAMAKDAGQRDREAFARERSDALKDRVPKLTIDVTDAPHAGLVVKRDGVEARAAMLGAPLPVDPGAHTIEASAPGKHPWSATVDVAVSESKTVAVPALEDEAPLAPAAPPAPPSVPEAAPPSGGMSPMRTAGLVAGAAGVGGLGLGAVFGGLAIAKKGDADSSGCQGDRCTAAGAAARNDARSYADVSTIAFVAGGVLLAGGVAAWLLAPRSDAVTVVPSAGPTGAGFILRGAF